MHLGGGGVRRRRAHATTGPSRSRDTRTRTTAHRDDHAGARVTTPHIAGLPFHTAARLPLQFTSRDAARLSPHRVRGGAV